MAGKARGSETTGDMVRAVFFLLGGLALVAGLFAINRPEPTLPDPVDYEGVLANVQDQYSYHVEAPARVPEDWRATSVHQAQERGGDQWRIGFLIDGESFVGLEQSDGETAAYLQDRLHDFEEDGVSTVDGENWERLVERGGNQDRALVRTAGGVVTIVRGTESYETLEEFVTWLE
ncbi:DUF4245 domain-containing protein [Phytoactinopolyspora mesophila]|nr:DUF4245 domain-containing protein [Phytoactinopolyspora mesophila]